MKNVEVWRMISDSLQKMNSNQIFNGVQCENKFKDLRRHYIATKDHNAQSGVQSKTCKFFNEMEEILSMKPSIKPVAIASNLKRRSIALQSHSITELGDLSMEAWENSDNSTEEIKIDKKEENVKKNKNGESTGGLGIVKSSGSTKKERSTRKKTSGKYGEKRKK